jgi:Tfp pilus assembly PilM family ATPase
LFGSRTTRTGIDLGGAAIKLVRGEVRDDSAVITHLGWEPVETAAGADRVAAAGAALGRLLRRLKLGRRELGRIAVGVDGRAALHREVELPALAEADLRRALRFEAGRHLDLEGLDDPVLDFQVLGPADRDPATGTERIRVLLAAVPRVERDAALAILRLAGLEPQVVDLQPLAALNAVLAQAGPQPTEATALLDLGAGHAAIHVGGRGGALLSRTLAAGGSPNGGQDAAAWRADLVEQLAQTLTFYRGRHRRRVARIVVAGRGALIPGVLDGLQGGLEETVVAFASLPGLAAEAVGRQEIAGQESLFAAAYGLCRWWDRDHV